MKTPLLFAALLPLLAVLLCQCNSNDNPPEPEPEAIDSTAIKIFDRLVSAYNESCNDCLEELITEWSGQFTADTEIPDSLLDVYEVYKVFFSPWDLTRISDYEHINDLYEGIDYYVIQDSVFYDFAYNMDEFRYNRKITNFRPVIANNSKTCLYLAKEYHDAFKAFLGSPDTPEELQDYMGDEEITYAEADKRNDSLAAFVKFSSGSWADTGISKRFQPFQLFL